MLSLRVLLIIIFSFTYAYTQSVFNSYGLGLNRTSYHTSVNGAGSIGLVPTFHPGVSMENVATWPGLNYTFISGSYSNQLFANEKRNVSNQAAGFSKIQFIIPILDRYGFGLSLKPLNNHNSFFTTDTSTIQYEGNNYTTNKEFRSGGGIMSGSFGFSFPINKNMGLGFSYNYLFGSSRDEQSMVINNTYYRLFNIRTYQGSTYKLDLGAKLFSNSKSSFLAFASIELTDKPVYGKLYQFDLFEDINNNYAFDSNDYPGEVGVDTIGVNNIYAPSSFSLGFNISLKNNLNIFSEYQLWNDEANNINYASIYNDQVGSKNHIGAGLIRFGNQMERDWQDRITFRGGIYKDIYELRYSGKSIIENGLSLGFGFKFAATGNQIDFSFRNGSRYIDGLNKELFREFTVGISVGDVWFLRRRAKQ